MAHVQLIFGNIASNSYFFSENRSSTQLTKYQTVPRKVGYDNALGGGDAKFFFRKRVFKHIKDVCNDPVEYHLLYAQAVQSVVMVSTSNFLSKFCRSDHSLESS
jgi:myosin-7